MVPVQALSNSAVYMVLLRSGEQLRKAALRPAPRGFHVSWGLRHLSLCLLKSVSTCFYMFGFRPVPFTALPYVYGDGKAMCERHRNIFSRVVVDLKSWHNAAGWTSA